MVWGAMGPTHFPKSKSIVRDASMGGSPENQKTKLSMDRQVNLPKSQLDGDAMYVSAF